MQLQVSLPWDTEFSDQWLTVLSSEIWRHAVRLSGDSKLRSLSLPHDPSSGHYSGHFILAQPMSLKSILLSFGLRLSVPNGLFTSGFQKKIVCIFLPSTPHLSCQNTEVFFVSKAKSKVVNVQGV
jgi:hypothetical protein